MPRLRTPFRYLCSILLILLFAGSTFRTAAQLSTSDHVAEPGFWPTQNLPSRNGIVGAEACATCHSSIFATQKTTPMGATAMHVENSEVLRSHEKLKFNFLAYRAEITTEHGQSLYKITDGEDSQTAPLLWAFGTGQVGQSYLFKQQDQKFYEARVTYFSSLHNLHFTPGRELTSPKNIDEAMYREVGSGEMGRCFACHTTASNIAGKFDEANLIPGISCEACHGAGAEHVAVMQASKLSGVSASATAIFNPATLRPADSVDFCGACHATAWDVKLAGTTGPTNARSQPYRLEKSKCWGAGDARLTCMGCHDPHKQLQTEASSYDAVCLSCHANGSKTGPAAKLSTEHLKAACPVEQKNCVSCHMPKVEVPEMHYGFTDHKIQIVRPGEGYKD
jgi:hypothetical protein